MYIFKFNKICRNAEGGGGAGGGDSAQGNADAGADSGATNADAGATAGADQTKVDDKAATGADADKAKASDFVLPDEYKEKPWAAKIKSTEDLCKQVDNLRHLLARKMLILLLMLLPNNLMNIILACVLRVRISMILVRAISLLPINSGICFLNPMFHHIKQSHLLRHSRLIRLMK